MDAVTVVGVGSHGRDIVEIARALSLPGVRLADDDARLGYETPDDLAPTSFLAGPWWPDDRHRLVGRLVAAGWRAAPPVVHPTAWIGAGVRLGPGVVIGAGAVLDHHVTLAAHVHVGIGARLVRATVGYCTSIGPGATVCGDVTIGARTLIGAGATVTHLVEIGCDATIGAGAVVLHSIPDGRTAVGVPAHELVDSV